MSKVASQLALLACGAAAYCLLSKVLANVVQAVNQSLASIDRSVASIEGIQVDETPCCNPEKEENKSINISEHVISAAIDSKEDHPQYDRMDAWVPLEYSVVFGVVGGLGPRAMTYFLEGVVTERCRLFLALRKGKTPEERLHIALKETSAKWTLNEVRQVYAQTEGRTQLLDQDHIPLLAAQATTVPPRPKYILKLSEVDPTPQIFAVARGLVAAGATHLVVICNTAHFFWSFVKQMLPRTVCMDMVAMTLEYIAELTKGHDTPVGLFATSATIKTSMYQVIAEESFEFKLVTPLDLPDGNERQACVEKVIFGEHGIKSGFDNPDRQEEARQCLRELVLEALQLKYAFGTTIVILACSELPLVLNEDSMCRWIKEIGLTQEEVLQVSNMTFVDPGRVLTHEMLRMTLLSRDHTRY